MSRYDDNDDGDDDKMPCSHHFDEEVTPNDSISVYLPPSIASNRRQHYYYPARGHLCGPGPEQPGVPQSQLSLPQLASGPANPTWMSPPPARGRPGSIAASVHSQARSEYRAPTLFYPDDHSTHGARPITSDLALYQQACRGITGPRTVVDAMEVMTGPLRASNSRGSASTVLHSTRAYADGRQQIQASSNPAFSQEEDPLHQPSSKRVADWAANEHLHIPPQQKEVQNQYISGGGDHGDVESLAVSAMPFRPTITGSVAIRRQQQQQVSFPQPGASKSPARPLKNINHHSPTPSDDGAPEIGTEVGTSLPPPLPRRPKKVQRRESPSPMANRGPIYKQTQTQQAQQGQQHRQLPTPVATSSPTPPSGSRSSKNNCPQEEVTVLTVSKRNGKNSNNTNSGSPLQRATSAAAAAGSSPSKQTANQNALQAWFVRGSDQHSAQPSGLSIISYPLPPRPLEPMQRGNAISDAATGRNSPAYAQGPASAPGQSENHHQGQLEPGQHIDSAPSIAPPSQPTRPRQSWSSQKPGHRLSTIEEVSSSSSSPSPLRNNNNNRYDLSTWSSRQLIDLLGVVIKQSEATLSQRHELQNLQLQTDNGPSGGGRNLNRGRLRDVIEQFERYQEDIWMVDDEWCSRFGYRFSSASGDEVTVGIGMGYLRCEDLWACFAPAWAGRFAVELVDDEE